MPLQYCQVAGIGLAASRAEAPGHLGQGRVALPRAPGATQSSSRTYVGSSAERSGPRHGTPEDASITTCAGAWSPVSMPIPAR